MTGNKSMYKTTKRLPIIAVALSALLVPTLVMAPPAIAQDQPQAEIAPEVLALARKYLDLTDHSGVYEATIVQAGINTYKQILPQNPKIADQLNTAIETVIASYKGRKGELFDQMARLYAITFSKDELQQIVDFYSSPVGQKLSKANAELNTGMQDVMHLFADNLRKEFFAKVRAELKAKGIDI